MNECLKWICVQKYVHQVWYVLVAMLVCLPACRYNNGTSSLAVTEQNLASDTVRMSGAGTLLLLEEAGYPFATAEIVPNDAGDTLLLRVNYSLLPSVDPGLLSQWVGKKVQFSVRQYGENSLLDLQKEGVSLLSTELPELGDVPHTITGILSGASEVTTGDLPSTIRIHDPERESLVFSCYVTPEMTRAEGSIVTGFFRRDTISVLSEIKQIP